MARAAKKGGKGGKAKGPAPAGWQAAADASEEQDELEGTGVLHEDGGEPTYIENLSPDEREDVGDQLADKLVVIAATEQDAKDTAAKFRKTLKALKRDRDVLRDEWRSGQRKVPAQAKLPGTEATS